MLAPRARTEMKLRAEKKAKIIPVTNPQSKFLYFYLLNIFVTSSFYPFLTFMI